jgi:hypothetical protein
MTAAGFGLSTSPVHGTGNDEPNSTPQTDSTMLGVESSLPYLKQLMLEKRSIRDGPSKRPPVTS